MKAKNWKIVAAHKAKMKGNEGPQAGNNPNPIQII